MSTPPGPKEKKGLLQRFPKLARRDRERPSSPSQTPPASASSSSLALPSSKPSPLQRLLSNVGLRPPSSSENAARGRTITPDATQSASSRQSNDTREHLDNTGVTTDERISQISSAQSSDALSAAGAFTTAYISVPLTEKRAWDNARTCLDLAKSGLKTGLRLASVAADSFPLAKGVLTGLQEILKLAETVQGNKESVREAIQDLQRVMDIVSKGDERTWDLFEEYGKRLLNVLEDLIHMRDQGVMSATLKSADDETKIKSCVARINKVLADFHFLLGVEMHRIVRQTEALQLDAEIRRELEHLLYSADAEYNTGHASGKRTGCLPGTRLDVLIKVRRWLLDPTNSSVFWLNGMAGTGKSTVADSFTAEAKAAGFVQANFFCARDQESARDIKRIFPSLAFQLAHKIPAYTIALVNVLKALRLRLVRPEDLSLEEQLMQLIVVPLKEIADTLPPCIPLITDAIDECNNYSVHPDTFVRLLLSHADDLRAAHIKFFISSRPAREISDDFKTDNSSTPHARVILHEISQEDIKHDIRIFVVSSFLEITGRHSMFQPRAEDIDVITNAASPLFIFASTLCAFIGAYPEVARYRLSQVISLLSPTGMFAGNASDATGALDRLYTTIFVIAFMTGSEGDSRYKDEGQAKKAMRVVAAILLLSQPLGLSALAMLLGPDYQSGEEIRKELLVHLWSVITEPSDDDKPVRILHASFQDHLTMRTRAHRAFFVDSDLYHGILAVRCLELMTIRLVKGNFLDLRPGVEHEESDIQSRTTSSVPRALEYACLYWSYHALRSSPDSSRDVIDVLSLFTRTHLLRWIEHLVALGNFSRAGASAFDVRQWLLTSAALSATDPNVKLLADVERFVVKYSDVIQSSPIQVYMSAFPFLPRNSVLRVAYADQVKHLEDLNVSHVALGLDEVWDPKLRILVAGMDVRCIAVSNDGVLLAGTNDDVKELFSWNLKSGHQIGRLESAVFKTGYQRPTMVFLPDNCLLGCYPSEQHLWSADATFSHAEAVDIHEADSLDWYTLAFSPDGAHLAGGATEEDTSFLAIWTGSDASASHASTRHSGAPLFALKAKHQLHSKVGSIAWSPDSMSLSVSLQPYVQIFAFVAETSLLPVAQLPYETASTVWSSEGNLIACWPDDDSSPPSVFSLALPDSNGQQAVQCRWNLAPSGESGPGSVNSIVFSSVDNTTIAVARGAEVRLWRIDAADSPIGSGSLLSIFPCGEIVDQVAFALSGTRIICRMSGYSGILVLDANAGIRAESSLSAADTSHSRVTQLSFSPLGRALAVARDKDNTVSIHDTADGTLAQKVTTHRYPSVGVMWGTEATIVAVSRDQATTYDIHTGSAIRNLVPPPDGFQYLACTFSPDTSHILLSAKQTNSTSLQALIYNTTSGSLLHSFPGGTVRNQYTTIATVAWSTTGCIAVGSAEGVKVWDFEALSSDLSPRRVCLVPPGVEGGEMEIDILAFSPSGSEIAASIDPSPSELWRVCVFNTKTGACLHDVEQGASVLNFSSDGTELHSDEGVIWRRENAGAGSGTQETLEMVRASDPRLTYSLSEDKKWIMDRHRRKVCRLSFEIKWGTFCAHGDHVAFADESEGRLFLLDLTPLDS